MYSKDGAGASSGGGKSTTADTQQMSKNGYIYDPISRKWVMSVLPSTTNPFLLGAGTSGGFDFEKSDAPIKDGVPLTKSGTVISFNDFVWDKAQGTWVLKPSLQKKLMSSLGGSYSGGSTSGGSSSAETAQKEYREIEFKTLEGEATVLPNENTLKIKAMSTVYLGGLGKFLSGKYFVSAVTRTLDSDQGYSQTMTVMRTGFGDSLKSRDFSDSESQRETQIRAKNPTLSFSVGDRIIVVAKDAVYSGSKEGVSIPAWVKTGVFTILSMSTDNSRVLIKELNSWVYTKDIQKA